MPPDFFHTSKYIKTYYFKMRMKNTTPRDYVAQAYL